MLIHHIYLTKLDKLVAVCEHELQQLEHDKVVAKNNKLSNNNLNCCLNKFNVINMHGMFVNTSANVTDMSNMFYNTEGFNRPINFKTCKVVNMSYIFSNGIASENKRH